MAVAGGRPGGLPCSAGDTVRVLSLGLLAASLAACRPSPVADPPDGWQGQGEDTGEGSGGSDTGDPDAGIVPPETIRLGTFNIWWLDDDYAERNEVDYAVIAELIEELDADVLALQEIDGEGAMELLGHHGLDTRYRWEVANEGWSVRTVLLYDSDVVELSDERELVPTDDAFRSVMMGRARVRGTDFELVVGSVHLASNYDPSNAHLRQLEAQGLHDYILRDIEDEYGEAGRYFSFAGDYNDTFEAIDDEYPSLEPLLEDPELVFATQNTEDFTLIGWESKIDHILLSDDLAGLWTGREDPVEGCQVFAHELHEYYGAYEGGFRGQQNISDHRPVYIDIAVPGG